MQAENNVRVELLKSVGRRKFQTILADPPWRFLNRKGKVSPEHSRLHRYETLSFVEIITLPIAKIATPTAPWAPDKVGFHGAMNQGATHDSEN